MKYWYSNWTSRKIHKLSHEPSCHHLAWYLAKEKSIHSLTQPHLQCHLFLSLFLIWMLTGAKQDKPQWESVLFQPVLKAYLTWYSWIITAHISIGNLNKQLWMFNSQKALVHELLMKLQCQPFVSNFVLNTFLEEFTTSTVSTNHVHLPYEWWYSYSGLNQPFINY